MRLHTRTQIVVRCMTLVSAVAIVATTAAAQASSRPCPPSEERMPWIGTCQTAVDSLGPLSRVPLFWHLNTYPAVASRRWRALSPAGVARRFSRPLMLPASSQALRPRHRRVIHLAFASSELPAGLEWYQHVQPSGDLDPRMTNMLQPSDLRICGVAASQLI